MNKVGIYFAYWTSDWKADFQYYIKKAAGMGFDVLEISTAYLHEESKEELKKLKDVADSLGIELTYCIGFPQDKDLASTDIEVRKSGIEYAKSTLEKIYFMGGKVFGGINYSSWPGVLKEGIVDKSPHMERSINSIRSIIKTAEDYGIMYCLEVVNRFEQYLLNTAQEGVDFVNAVGSQNLKLLLDVFHMNIEEDSIGEAIITAGNKIGHLHIGESNRKTPGKGHMPWDEIATALKKINYKERIVMEPFVRMGGEVGRDIKVWRDLSNNADEKQLDVDAKAALDFIRNKIK